VVDAECGKVVVRINVSDGVMRVYDQWPNGAASYGSFAGGAFDGAAV
jgi:hypothetical protein